MKRKIFSILLCVIVALVALLHLPANAAQDLQPYVTTEASTAEEVLSAWESGRYSYIKLGADMALTLDGQNLVVDLAGFDLNLKGRGQISGFDTANDMFDHLACGVFTAWI